MSPLVRRLEQHVAPRLHVDRRDVRAPWDELWALAPVVVLAAAVVLAKGCG